MIRIRREIAGDVNHEMKLRHPRVRYENMVQDQEHRIHPGPATSDRATGITI